MDLISNLKKHIRKQQFLPDFTGIFINPFYISRKELYKNIKEISFTINGRILDVGCGQKPYKSLFSYADYIGMDIEQSGHPHANENIDVFYDGKNFPFPDESFDSIICSQVFEHVFNPNEFLKEIYRVLKPSGKFLLTVPFVWDEHEQPYDFGRYSSFGLVHILKESGLEVIELRKSAIGLKAISQLLVGFIYKIIYTKNSLINLLLNIFFISPITILGIISSKVLFKNKDLYLDNIIIAKKGFVQSH